MLIGWLLRHGRQAGWYGSDAEAVISALVLATVVWAMMRRLQRVNRRRGHAENKLRGTAREVTDLRAALDENAIVAITEAREKNGELERANAKLRASEERFRGTLESMLEGCQIIDRDWRYLYVNQTAARHGQRTRDELVGRTMMESYPGFEASEAFATLRRCMEERTTARIVNEFLYADGSKASFELSVQPVPEGLFILSLDVTERSKAGQKIDAQLEELRRWQEVMLNREDRVHALKAEVNDLRAQLRLPPRFASPMKP